MEFKNVEKHHVNNALPVYKVIKDGQECWVPNDLTNRDCIELKKHEREQKIVISEVDLSKR